MNTTSLSERFKKLCSINTNDNLSILLAQTLATADRDAYLVFLDLLEEVHPQVRKALDEPGPGLSLASILNLLEEAAPKIIKYYQNNVWSIQVPTFGGFNRVGHDGGRVMSYAGEFEVNFDITSLTGNLVFLEPVKLNINDNDIIDVRRIIYTSFFEIISTQGQSFISNGSNGINTIFKSCIAKADKDYQSLRELLVPPSKKRNNIK